MGVGSLLVAGVRVLEASAAHRATGVRAKPIGTSGLRLYIRFHQVRGTASVDEPNN